jgi:uncharacterized protein YihD (DUF1040 family)
MRDVKRIERIIRLLEQAWKYVPDWRMGQLVSNILGVGVQDVFYVEDDTWELKIKMFIKNHESNTIRT